MDQEDTHSHNPQSARRSVTLITDRGVSGAVKVLAAVAGVMLAGIALFQTYAIISRYFGAPILGSIDIVKYLMLGLVVLSLCYAQDQRAHVSVDIVTSRFPPIAQNLLDILTVICTVLASGVVALVFYQAFMSTTSAGNSSTGLIAIPVKPFQFLIFLGFAAWAISAATALLPSRRQELREKPLPSESQSTT